MKVIKDLDQYLTILGIENLCKRSFPDWDSRKFLEFLDFYKKHNPEMLYSEKEWFACYDGWGSALYNGRESKNEQIISN